MTEADALADSDASLALYEDALLLADEAETEATEETEAALSDARWYAELRLLLIELAEAWAALDAEAAETESELWRG